MTSGALGVYTQAKTSGAAAEAGARRRLSRPNPDDADELDDLDDARESAEAAAAVEEGEEEEEEQEEEHALADDELLIAQVAAAEQAAAAARLRLAVRQRTRGSGALSGRAAGGGVSPVAAPGEWAHRESEATEMSASETGAFFGSVVLSPGGVPGVLVGGAIGFAAGMLVETVGEVRSKVSTAYRAVLRSEERAVAHQAHARSTVGAIETISVSSDDPAEASALASQLGDFLLRPPNRRCADCAAKLVKRSDAWVSTSLGVVLCIECAAAHRHLGPSVSRVKSPVFDKWDVPTVQQLLEKGNDVAARTFYNGSTPARVPRPDSPEPERRAHAREKYVRMRWAAPEVRDARQALMAQSRAAAEARAGGKRKDRPPGEQPGAGTRGRRMASLSSE
jgi:hypothetical protein